jgi:ketosteroid isomerase-like protein
MTSDRDDFDRFLQARHAAAQEYVSGNPEPLSRLVARELPATFFSPRGDVTTGTREVATRYEKDDAVFTEGSENVMETLDAAAGDEIAFWVGLQRSEARMRGQEEPVSFDLRVTEIYRRESGQWRLVHRHADPRMDVDQSP